jgi:hypothetical protein
MTPNRWRPTRRLFCHRHLVRRTRTMLTRRRALAILGAAGIGTGVFQRALAGMTAEGPVSPQMVEDAEDSASPQGAAAEYKPRLAGTRLIPRRESRMSPSSVRAVTRSVRRPLRPHFLLRAAAGRCHRTSLRMRRASATAFLASDKENSGPASGYRSTVAHAVSRSRTVLSTLGRSLGGIRPNRLVPPRGQACPRYGRRALLLRRMRRDAGAKV